MAARDLLLQPVSAGDLIDRALRLYRKNLGSLLAIAAIPGLIAVVGGLLTVFAQDQVGSIILGGMIIWVVTPILNLMVVGALTRVLADYLMVGREISFRRTWRLLLVRSGRLFGVALIGWLLLFVSLMILGGGSALGIGVGTLVLTPALGPAQAGGAPSWLIMVPVAILLGLAFLGAGLILLSVYGRVLMMPAASLMEEQPVGSAVSRGLHLGAKTAFKVLAVVAFEFCLTYAIALALGVPIGLYAAIEGLPLSAGATANAFNVLLQIGALLTAPVPLVAYALLYFDNRVRKDGFDVEILAGEIANPVSSSKQAVVSSQQI
jgi:hypothetical protein